MNRRTFLAATAATQLASNLPLAQAATLPIKKGILYGMLPKQMPLLDRFQMAREIGFEQMECPQIDDPAEAEAIKKAADQAKLPIHSVMNGDHWRFPLNSNDPEVVAKSMKAMRTSLGNAKLWGAETVLLVPAVVSPDHSYAEAYKRSQARIRELIPLAAEYKVVIAVEEVWNKFLLSPLEFARYVDEFKSPWVKAYFDVGNIVLFAYPQDWIRTLGKRIVKLHFKDFKFQQNRETRKREAEFVNLGEGEIDWKAIHAALAEIGYRGTATVELSGGDRTYLADVSKRVDKILAGA
ncbi:MAG: sugar phosphate isomerase/epimerase [Acidobacteria bacterium]|nr:sugar phosphate isomerase/epimerase [Acidobacteriota bacterium]